MNTYKTYKSDFPERFHQLIFASINNLYKNGAENIDAVAIDDFLSNYETQYRVFERNNGVDFILAIADMARPINIKYYHDQLKKFSLLRRYVENGVDVSEFFDPTETDPVTVESQRSKLDESSITDIINHFKKKHLEIISPFSMSEERDSKKAGAGGQEQKEKWKQETAWGIGYASAYLTTALHGLRKGRYTVKSAGTGSGKTRTMISDIGNACSPYLYDKETKQWLKNPNGVNNGCVYIGTEMELLQEIDPILWAYIADVPQEHIEFNMYEDDEEERVDEAIRILEEEANIWFEYTPEYGVDILSEIIEEHKIKHNISHVFFDYIHITTELSSEFAAKSKSRMIFREDQILAELSSKIKTMARKFDVSFDTCTQISGDYKNIANRDETIVKGARAITFKADSCLIAMEPTEVELKKIENITRNMLGCPTPNLVYTVYKNRGGKYNHVKIWLYIDYGTMRTQDLFVTDNEYRLDGERVKGLRRTYINVEDEEVTSSEKHILPINIKEMGNNKIQEIDIEC